ncbi:lysophospholipase L1-like esterase [Larkinella arboricola]|uniref:Lysophospholipase L1-like esterase n=1 Tax=Larkinella arboricola TaxID=643671 RepID=A0A327WN45_LARAB|nr:exo-alpha-sialidase [Larkinella arboricola]RAJ93111.1 lysophospholipase L1-like esterase [Larkinella arboricola]
MRFSVRFLLTVFCFGISLAVFARKPATTNKDNLTIVAFGNSITATRKTVNQVFAQRLPHLLSQKGVSATVINAGIPGSHTGRQTDHNLFKIRHALDRFESDVLAKQPDLTIIGFGINDAHIDKDGPNGPSRIPLEKYRENLSYMIESLQKQGSKIILTVPNPLGQKYPAYQNERLQGYVNTIREFARKYRTGLVDNNQAFRAYQTRTGVSFDSLMLDGVHPNDKGHELIAENMANEVVRVVGHKVNPDDKKLVLQLNPGPDNPRNSEGDFVTLKDGRILFIYSRFTGKSASDFASASLVGRYSSDGGKTWTTEDVPIVRNEGNMNVMSVSLLRLKDGRIALFYARKNSMHDCIPMMRISTDEAKTWSEATPVITDRKEYFVLNNNRVIQLESGRILVPVALHESPVDPVFNERRFNERGRPFCYYSDDLGKSWKRSEEIANPDNVVLQEPGLIQLNNNQTMMIIRTDAGVQYAAYSTDQGASWSPAKPTDIVSPVSPATIARIPKTGDLLMVWNNNDMKEGNPIKGRRTPMNIAVSKDEGKTWTHVKTIEADPDGWYCYTAIHFVGKKDILLSYCAGNRPKGTGLSVTNVTRLSLDWIYGKKK